MKLRGGYLVLVSLCGCLAQAPTDEAIIAQLNAHRSDYERLVAMFRTDRLNGVWESEVRPKGLISEARFAEYKAKFRELGINHLRVANGDGVFLQLYATGLFFAGERKGLFYSESPVPSVVPSLNTRPAGLPPNVPAFRTVADNWYVEYEYGG